jgi:hypothetical protein
MQFLSILAFSLLETLELNSFYVLVPKCDGSNMNAIMMHICTKIYHKFRIYHFAEYAKARHFFQPIGQAEINNRQDLSRKQTCRHVMAIPKERFSSSFDRHRTILLIEHKSIHIFFCR